MDTPKNSWLAAAIVVAVALGFVVGRTSKSDTKQSADAPSLRSKPDISHARPATRRMSSVRSRGTSSRQTHRRVGRALEPIISQLESRPMDYMDFDVIFEAWEVVRGFSENDILNAMPLVEQIKNPQLRSTMRMMLMNRWGKINGLAAIEYAMQEEDRQARLSAAMGVFTGWLKNDPEGAADWFEANGDKMNSGGGMFGSLYYSIVYQALARHNFNRALVQVGKITGKKQKRMALTGIGQVVATDPAQRDQFLAYLDSEVDSSYRKDVMESVIRTMAMQDADQAKAFLASLDDPDEKKALTSSALQSLSYMDPKGAIEWGVEQAGTDEERKEVIPNLLSTWARQDAAAASEWYDQQPEHLKSDEAATSTATMLGLMEQYEDAFEWAERVQDQDTLNQTKKTIYTNWRRESPDAAKAWLEGKGREVMEGIDLEDLD